MLDQPHNQQPQQFNIVTSVFQAYKRWGYMAEADQRTNNQKKKNHVIIVDEDNADSQVVSSSVGVVSNT